MGVHGFFGLFSASRLLPILVSVSVLCSPVGYVCDAIGEEPTDTQNSLVVKGDLNGAFLRTRIVEKSFRDAITIRPVFLSGSIQGFGRVKAILTTQRMQPALLKSAQHPVLLQGIVSIAGGTVPVAAYSSGDSVELSFVTKKVRTRRVRPRIYRLHVPVNRNIGAKGRVSSVPVTSHVMTCGQESQSTDSPLSEIHHKNVELVPATKPVRIVTIATDADTEWYLKHGEDSAAVIAKFLNIAEVLYDAQFSIRFRIVSQHSYREQSPYTATDVGGLLAQFVINSENPTNFGVSREEYRDAISLNHLFTGKDLEGSVVGMAYIGVLCSAPALSYGVTQYFGDLLTPLILAHELGHNFGAYHDISDSTGLMYPNISVPAPNHFSSTSIREISNHLAANSKCLLQEVAPILSPIPTVEGPPSTFEDGNRSPLPAPDLPSENNQPAGNSPLTVSLQKERIRIGDSAYVRVKGRVFSSFGALAIGTLVELLAEGVPVSQSITNSLGEFSFFIKVRTPEKKRVLAWVKVVKSGEESNRLTLKRAPRFSKRVRGRTNVRPYEWPVVTLS